MDAIEADVLKRVWVASKCDQFAQKCDPLALSQIVPEARVIMKINIFPLSLSHVLEKAGIEFE